MSFLSNWRSDRNPPHPPPDGTPAPVTCRPVRPDEVSAAIRLVLSPDPYHPATDEQVLDFLRYSLARGIDTRATRVAERNGQILTAALPIPSAGRTMLLLTPPHFPTPGHRTASSLLLDHTLDAYQLEGTHLVQILLDPIEQDAATLYAHHGFERLAELLYLQTTTRRATTPPPLPPGHSLVTYSLSTHRLFADTIAATYHGSLDCPALAGRRDIEDIVAGHRAAGEFHPDLWLLLLGPSQEPLGVALLAPAPPADSMELVYLGLTPAARGRALGDLLLRHAMYLTHAFPLPKFTLAVDSTNAPALKLYYRHGLRRIQSKLAFMCDLRKRTLATPPAAPPAPPTESSTPLPQAR